MDARDHPRKPVAGRSSGRFGLQGRTFSSCTERVFEDAKLTKWSTIAGRRRTPRTNVDGGIVQQRDAAVASVSNDDSLASADQPAFETKSLRQQYWMAP